MKYSGSITIFDDQGNTVFERELGTDEIIETLIERINFFQKPPESGEALVVGPHNIGRVIAEAKKKLAGSLSTPPKRKYTKRKKKQDTEQLPKTSRRVGDAKECCGSTGARHFKWCTEAGGTGNPAFVRQPSSRIPFSEKTYDTVKGLFAIGLTTDAVAAEKGFDMNELAKIRKSSSYDEYFKKG